ncbi:hypothetical protein K458DRAFT_420227 [Lentithecium fluviatile CBS 122367]|uniref:Uncharacterized protein n=1 Tax=Lentithecium fluviatile CBS 122367 TaxID=1168545 RepID=A0A6G1IV75_9PLEO|nr:hypothetical protein K458DRAFT_420227 [Lentithecium fluviatile CBS 122367]
MNEEREILVHISAPATRQKDDLYRELANAYLEFEPHETDDGLSRINPGRGGATPNVNSSKDSYGSFPSQIESGDHSSSQNQANVRLSSSLNEDSELDTSRLGQLERIHARWRRSTAGTGVASVRPSSAKAPLSSAFSDTAFIDDTQLAYQALESQLLDNPSATSQDTSDDESKVARIPSPQSVGDPQSARRTTVQKASLSSDGIEADPSPPHAETSAAIIHHDFPNDPKPQVQSQDPDFQACSFQHLPVEVYPPPPTVTVQAPGKLPSQITRYLGTLKEQNPSRFKPSGKFRALDQDERGHWAVDSSAWPYSLQSRFWTSLAEHVGSGKLGWGVTLHRDASHPRELGLIRLYCWGEIVEHIWLALWLCSEGKISNSGPKWIDAEDHVVIQILER